MDVAPSVIARSYTGSVAGTWSVKFTGLPPRVSGPSPGIDLRGEERERILSALRAAKGRKGDAAERLGINRSTLWRKLREYKIEDG